MGNTCNACAHDCATLHINKQHTGDLDLQAEFSQANGRPDGTVVLSARAAELPRLALGKPDGRVEMIQAEKIKISSPNDIALVKSSSEDRTETRTPQDLSQKDSAPLVPPSTEKQAEIHNEEPEAPFLEVVFEDKGIEKKVRLFKRPLGAEFSKKSKEPAKVSKVRAQGYAGELGIQAGWILKSIGGQDVSSKSFQETQNILRNGLITLPEDVRRRS